MFVVSGLHNPAALQKKIATRVRQCRLGLRWSQEEVAKRAGVKLGTYRLFEQTGHISLNRLCRVAIALGRTGDLERMFEPPPVMSVRDLPDDDRAQFPKHGRTQR